MSTFINNNDSVDDVQLNNLLDNLLIRDEMNGVVEEDQEVTVVQVVEDHHHGLCAICLDKIALQETALVKGCEHAYCVTCILQWASYSEDPKCPQCKHRFESLNVHRSLDGSLHDYMFEESVCLLLRATWFKPLVVEHQDDLLYGGLEEIELHQYYYEYEDEGDDDMDEAYFGSSSTMRIGNRRWGDNGYVRSGRKEARPANRSDFQDSGAKEERGQ